MDGTGKGERIWVAEAQPIYDEEGRTVGMALDPDELNQLAVDAATVVRMCGGVCTFGAERVEVTPGVFETVRVMFRWHSYAPAQRQRQEPVQEEPVAEEEPSAEELEALPTG